MLGAPLQRLVKIETEGKKHSATKGRHKKKCTHEKISETESKEWLEVRRRTSRVETKLMLIKYKLDRTEHTHTHTYLRPLTSTFIFAYSQMWITCK